MTLDEKKERAVWIARSLFERGKTSGTTANLSFRQGESVWITASGSCFGRMETTDLVEVSLLGKVLGERQPSKELSLHLALYGVSPDIEAVIHTHSRYATLWSCLDHEDQRNVFPAVTPYLGMKLGGVAEIPFAPPGSDTLFSLAREYMHAERGYLLKNHGPIVGGKSLMNAFEAIEELEETAFLSWSAYAAGIPLNQIT